MKEAFFFAGLSLRQRIRSHPFWESDPNSMAPRVSILLNRVLNDLDVTPASPLSLPFSSSNRLSLLVCSLTNKSLLSLSRGRSARLPRVTANSVARANKRNRARAIC